MKVKRIYNEYRKNIETFGLVGGNKIFFARVGQRMGISKAKTVFSVKIPRLEQRKIYLRKNTTDLFLASELLCEGGEYDFMLEHPYQEVLKEAKVIVDAGANIGIFSCICRSVNPECKIVCIEPESENYQVLNKNMQDRNAICYKKGLWNKETNLSVISRDTGEWGFIVKENINVIILIII